MLLGRLAAAADSWLGALATAQVAGEVGGGALDVSTCNNGWASEVRLAAAADGWLGALATATVAICGSTCGVGRPGMGGGLAAALARQVGRPGGAFGWAVCSFR